MRQLKHLLLSDSTFATILESDQGRELRGATLRELRALARGEVVEQTDPGGRSLAFRLPYQGVMLRPVRLVLTGVVWRGRPELSFWIVAGRPELSFWIVAGELRHCRFPAAVRWSSVRRAMRRDVARPAK